MPLCARDIMTAQVHTVTEDTRLEDLARQFSEKGVSGFPVVNSQGQLSGVVTEADLIHQNARLHIPTTFVLLEAVIMLGRSKKLEEEMRRMAATVVGEIMTRSPVTVEEDTPLAEVAGRFAEEHVHTLPVLDAEGNLTGVIGKLDIIRSMAGA